MGRSRHKLQATPGPRSVNCLVLSPDSPLLLLLPSSHAALVVPNCYSAFLTAAPGLVLLPHAPSTSAGVIAGTAHCIHRPQRPGQDNNHNGDHDHDHSTPKAARP